MLKKAAISIGVLGAAGLVGYWVYKQESSQAQRYSAAQFLPQETLLFVEAPDLAASAQRWGQTGIARILHEPEVKGFLEKPLARLRKEAPTLGVLRRVQARQAFVAITRVDDNNMPFGVAGFSYGAPKEEIAGLVNEAKKKAQQASPHGKSELTKYKKYEIESFTSDNITLAGTFADDWYFIANSVDLLKETLDRFETPSGEGRLSQSEVFKKSLNSLPHKVEAAGFAQPQFFYDKIISLSAASGSSPSEADIAEMKKIKGIAGSLAFDGPLIRESLFTYAPGIIRQPNLSGFSLDFTSPQTLLYGGTTLPSSERLAASLAANPALKQFDELLQQKGLKIQLVADAVGSEFGFYGEWPVGAMMPSFAVAIEVKDEAKARTLLDALPQKWATSVQDDVVYKSMPPIPMGIPISLAPSIALTKKAVIGSLDRVALEGLVAKTKEKGETLEANPTYKQALATVGKPDNQIIYFDTKTFFERFYGSMRPMIQLSGGFIPGVADVVDLSKLPTTEAISKHLLPTMATSRYTDDGTLFESTGSLSLQGIVMGGVAGSTFAFFQQKMNPSAAPEPEESSTPAPETEVKAEAAATPEE